MKIYIAASFPRKEDANSLAEHLKKADHIIVSRWHNEDSEYATEDQMVPRAQRDMDDMERCNMMIQYTGDNLSHGGRHCECGIAVALHKDVVLIGPREQVIHWLPRVDVFETVGDFIYAFAPELMA